ncbi:MAG: UDP-3-O-(3-hydroxymyristoyl)glucosamine N-acyltransferase [Acidobacteriia bacterium]|nr:UDP-3-O-(3-hydroxymyristoyl)glucosamine N-acyltransferase [Terriglobia bacterium]
MRLGEIAKRLNCRLEGDSGIEIRRVLGIETAGEGDLTFISNPKYVAAAKTTRASALIVSEDFAPLPQATLRCENPYLTFAKAIELFYSPPQYSPGIHTTACIDPTSRIGARAHVGPYVVIHEDVVIGNDAVLVGPATIYRGVRIGDHFFAHANVVVREYCLLGNNVILQNGVVVGGDGFGFAKQSDGSYYKMVQSGIVILEDDVEIGANSTIDRGTIGETRVKKGAKIDNLVQVGHASTVGENSLLCAQVGLAGSTVVGKDVVLTGQVGVAGHLTIGDGVVVTAQSGIPRDVPAGQVISGSPAIENYQWLKATAVFAKLPELQKSVRELARRLDALSEQMKERPEKE